MSRSNHRKSDPLNVNYPKTSRVLESEAGFFYKSRGGIMNGPYKTEGDALKELKVFIQILKIEEELDVSDLQMML